MLAAIRPVVTGGSIGGDVQLVAKGTTNVCHSARVGLDVLSNAKLNGRIALIDKPSHLALEIFVRLPAKAHASGVGPDAALGTAYKAVDRLAQDLPTQNRK